MFNKCPSALVRSFECLQTKFIIVHVSIFISKRQILTDDFSSLPYRSNTELVKIRQCDIRIFYVRYYVRCMQILSHWGTAKETEILVVNNLTMQNAKINIIQIVNNNCTYINWTNVSDVDYMRYGINTIYNFAKPLSELYR